MTENNRYDILNNPGFFELYEDIQKVLTVLPNVPLKTIISGLSNLPEKNRVLSYLKIYFYENKINDEGRNSMKYEIKLLEDLLPDYSKDSIIMNLMKVQNKQYRVQYVLRKYFDEKYKHKRPLDDPSDVDTTPDKKIKITDLSEDKTYIIDLDDSQESVKYVEKKNTMPQTVIQVLKELFPNASQEYLLGICSEYGYKLKDVLSHDELNMFINQVIVANSTEHSCQTCEPQPSTSSYGLELVAAKEDLRDRESSTTIEYDFDWDSGLNLELSENPVIQNSFPEQAHPVIKQDLDQDSSATEEYDHEFFDDELDFMAIKSPVRDSSVEDIDRTSTVLESNQEQNKGGFTDLETQAKADNRRIHSLEEEEKLYTDLTKPSKENPDEEEQLWNKFFGDNPPLENYVKLAILDENGTELVEEKRPFSRGELDESVEKEDGCNLNQDVKKNENISICSLTSAFLEQLDNDKKVAPIKLKDLNQRFKNKSYSPVEGIEQEIMEPVSLFSNVQSETVDYAGYEDVQVTEIVKQEKSNEVIDLSLDDSEESESDYEELSNGSGFCLSKITGPQNKDITNLARENQNFSDDSNDVPAYFDRVFSILNKVDENKNKAQPVPDTVSKETSPINLSPKVRANKASSSEVSGILDNVPVPDSTTNNKAGPSIIKPARLKLPTSTDVAGPSKVKVNNNNAVLKSQYYRQLMEMFPDISPDYLRNICANVVDNKTMEDTISLLLSTDYDKRERVPSPTVALDHDEQMHMLQELFPDADPTFLEFHCTRLINDPDEFRVFVTTTLEQKDYPTKEEYMRKLKLTAQEKKYTTEFSVKNFLDVIPDPEAYFSKPNRPPLFDINHKKSFHYQNYTATFFRNVYNMISVKDISKEIYANKTLVDVAKVLDTYPRTMKSKRKVVPLPSCDNIPLLQELAFIQHKQEILHYIKEKNEEKKRVREIVKQGGEMKSCECCFDDEVMPDEVIHCDNGHKFCKECVRRGAEVEIGQGKLDFPCLQTCDAKFSLQILQLVLKPQVFSKMAQRKQLEEIRAAGIEDLVACPFCDFATIPAPGDKLFRCLNEECMKESCLSCREISHIPLRCDEIEKEKDVQIRTYIEDKMTEALLRKCYKCGLKFIKEGGCNKMTCSCGAMMCYICNSPVKDYKHFNGQGGDQFNLCPLYSDTIQLHEDAVKRGAELAKAELGVTVEELKIDPTTGLEKHYKDIKKRNPHNEEVMQHIQLMRPILQLHRADIIDAFQRNRMNNLYYQLQNPQRR